MSNIAFINGVPYGSTGSIIRNIAKVAEAEGNKTFIYYGWTKRLHRSKENNVFVGSFVGRGISLFLSYITGYTDMYSFLDTYLLIRKLKRFQPDVINLHILHGRYVNLRMLFSYIKHKNIPVVWTMHDCWALTGQCPHFTMVKCDKWKNGCYKCPQFKESLPTLRDGVEVMWKKKKEWFLGVKNMTIVTPSQWLASLVEQSFLREYPVKVINNGIDLTIFKPTESKFREQYDIKDKKIVLGVAFGWGKRKGLDVFIELSNRMSRETYQFVLVGTDDVIDKTLPQDIISVHRTQNQKELAEIYTAADVFVNPTREENYPTVNMEAIACGTPVITFDTGGSSEMLTEKCGRVVMAEDIDGLEKLIRRVCESTDDMKADCLEQACRFNMDDRFLEYIALYNDVVKN